MTEHDNELFRPANPPRLFEPDPTLFAPAARPGMFEPAPPAIPAPPVEAPEKVATSLARIQALTASLAVDVHGIRGLLGHPYTQYAGTPSCFFSGVQLARFMQTGTFPDETLLTIPARERGLMDDAGAVTGTEEKRMAIERLIMEVHGIAARFDRPRAFEHRDVSVEEQIQRIIIERRNIAMVLYHQFWQGNAPVGEWEAFFAIGKKPDGTVDYISNYSPQGLTGRRDEGTFAALLHSTHNSYFPMLCEIQVITPLMPRGMFAPAS